MEKKTRNRTAHYNLSLSQKRHNPSSKDIVPVMITYSYKKERKFRNAPIDLPMNVFVKLKLGFGSIKKGYETEYKTQNKWLQKFRAIKNDLEVRMKEGEIDYQYAFKVLNNDYEGGIISKLYPGYAQDSYISKSVERTIMSRLATIQNHFKGLGYNEYGVLDYSHLQRMTDIKNIKRIILKEIESIDNSTRKKYFGYLNQMAKVNPQFTETEKTPFNVKLKHSRKPPRIAITHSQLKEGILNIGDNLYNLESYLWWLLSFCLRGVDTCDIVAMNESMIESNSEGIKHSYKGVLREYYPWNSNIVQEGNIFPIQRVTGENKEVDEEFEKMYGNMFKCNDEKFYLVGKRQKEVYKGKEGRSAEVKILYNQTPVLLIHKMLKKVISIIHPDLAYKGNDKLKLYNLDYKTPEGKRTWHNRRGTMSESTQRLFGATLKQSRHTFTTKLSEVLSVDYKQAEKDLSTSLGHSNNKSQRFYVNVDQDRMDILQIEVIERFQIRDIVESLIKVCSTIQVKNQEGLIEPMLDEKYLKYSPLDVKASWWNWNKELRFNQLRKEMEGDFKLVQNKEGKFVKKISDISSHPEFAEMMEERRTAFVNTRKEYISKKG